MALLCAKAEDKYLHKELFTSDSRNGLTAFAVFFSFVFVRTQDKPVFGVGCRSPPAIWIFKIQIGGKERMAYNHGKAERRWRLGKKEEKDFTGVQR